MFLSWPTSADLELRGAAVLGGFALDLLLGDPQGWPHPVRWIGRAVAAGEWLLRRPPLPERAAGALLTVVIVAGASAAAWCLRAAAEGWRPGAGLPVEAVLVYFCLSLRSLRIETERVLDRLAAEDLPGARAALARIVGRDTAALDEPECLRACVETVAEGTLDGVLSPLAFACLGGAPAALAFKAASTLDSMVGYRNVRYLRFGWASARLDDLLNFIPARLSVLFLAAGALLTGRAAGRALALGLRDGHKNPSPNSGYPEAAMAGALGVRLGGTNTYAGVRSDKPFLGEARVPLDRAAVRGAFAVSYAASFLAVLAGYGTLHALARL